MNYEEKISLLDEEDFIVFFSRLNAMPRWVTSAGKRAIQLIGLCHNGDNHSALFDPSTLKVHCFSECGKGMLFHTWVKQACHMSDAYEAKEFIEDWIDNQEIDFSQRVPASGLNFEYKERLYKPEVIKPLKGISEDVIQSLYNSFDTSDATLSRLIWNKEDGINTSQLQKFQVAYNTKNKTIILPHHNINGTIVGLYERSFKKLRKEVREKYPDMPYRNLLEYPRAKYVPLLRDPEYRTEEKTSWSFPNSFNLYGLHIAKTYIKETGIAIVFEGGKSVMLANQYGYPMSVATHTFGIHLNHISMLIECGAKEIILAFDKQYEKEEGQAWELFCKKTDGVAEKVKEFVKISRLTDKNNLIGFKDSPIDKGKRIFETLYHRREKLGDNLSVSKPKQLFETDPLIEKRKQLLRKESEKCLRHFLL